MWAEQAACVIYMKLNDLQVPGLELSEPTSASVTTSSTRLTLGDTELQVSVTYRDGDAVSYSTGHCFSRLVVQLVYTVFILTLTS